MSYIVDASSEYSEDTLKIEEGLLGRLDYGDREEFNTCSDCGALIPRWHYGRCNPCSTKFKKKQRMMKLSTLYSPKAIARAKKQALWIVSVWERMQVE